MYSCVHQYKLYLIHIQSSVSFQYISYLTMLPLLREDEVPYQSMFALTYDRTTSKCIFEVDFSKMVLLVVAGILELCNV